MKKLIIIQIVSALVVLGCLWGLYQGLSVEISRAGNCQDLENELAFERAYMQENLYEALANDGIALSIPEITSDSVALICFFSSLSCNSCVNFAMQKIDEHFAQGKYPVYFIAAGFNEKYNFDREVIRWPSRSVSHLPVTETLYAFYFLWKDGRVRNLFIPERNYAGYADVYLSTVKKMLASHQKN